MATKTQRILSYLPAPFLTSPPGPVLTTVVDSFGNELLSAENSLAAVMLAHWVDKADLGGDLIADLACIASLYSLTPRNATPLYRLSGPGCPPLISDEDVEEFRLRLKRHVRTFLDGTVTVQGVLRVVAEALGLDITYDYANMDTWWRRPDDTLITEDPPADIHAQPASTPTTVRRRFVTRAFVTDEAALAIFGFVRMTGAGQPATAAAITGIVDLTYGVDVSRNHMLRVAVDGQPATQIDLARELRRPRNALPEEITAALAPRLPRASVSASGGYLTLESRTAGAASQIAVEAHADDAFTMLFGDAGRESRGAAPTRATITGTADLRVPVNLVDRHVIRLSIDGARPVDVDVAGDAPESTTLGEIAGRLNQLHPGIATPVEDAGQDHLQLSSPTAGATSSLELLPLRALELIDYPPRPADEMPHSVRQGGRWTANNDGAAEADLTITIMAPHGELGPEVLNLTTKRRIRVTSGLDAGETLELTRASSGGLKARICRPDGKSRIVPSLAIVAGPPGAQVQIPFSGEWTLGRGDDGTPTLQLNDPDAPSVLILRAREVATPPEAIGVRVVEARLDGRPPTLPPADGRMVQLAGRLRRAGADLELPRGGAGVRLVTDPDLDLDAYENRVVSVTGTLEEESGARLLSVQSVVPLFDVTIQGLVKGKHVEEKYTRVTIGRGLGSPQSLWHQITAASTPSKLVSATEIDKGDALILPRGQSEWLYLSCLAARFDAANFDAARFAGGACVERGIFDASRFTSATPEPEAVFSGDPPFTEPTVDVLFSWSRFQPGAFTVNLPVDLPPQYGARFDLDRFARDSSDPERYEPVVAEPDSDPLSIIKQVEAGSKLVSARRLGRAPIGWDAVPIPFQRPRQRNLRGGIGEKTPARLYLAEPGATSVIELSARIPGAWGNEVVVSVRPAGPARYELSVWCPGTRFENARQIALGACLDALTADSLRPGPVGALQAKAAGILATITRDHTFSDGNEDPCIRSD